MFIQSVELNNFKGFSNENNKLQFNLPNGTPGSGLNIFTGENNCGKSTIFEAISFIRDGSKKDAITLINKNTSSDEFYVEIIFSGNINEVIDNYSDPKKIAAFKKHISADGNFKVRRIASKLIDPDSIKKVKAIGLWDEEKSEFANPSGIDAPFKALYDNNFIWADTNAEDEAKFGASTLCGSLLKEIAQGHTESEEYKKFSAEFHKIFNDPSSQLRTTLSTIENQVNAYIAQQFGSANIKFSFDELSADNFFKSTKILIDDGVEVAMTEKGHGLQRAVALALLRVYADIVSKKDQKNLEKPFFLFIDEPEICLHPIAQAKLLDSIIEISKTKQVFISTHSPFFFRSRHLNNFGIFIFNKDNNNNITKKISIDGIFNKPPTFSEIAFNAYNLATEDFHDELYGHLQSITGNNKENQIDEFLYQQGSARNKLWTRQESDGSAGQSTYRTIQVFIRNKIHHPENQHMQHSDYSPSELRSSIEKMIEIINGIQLQLQPASLAGVVTNP